MFPYTSDDGFSVTDFKAINPELGDWEDIENLRREYDLMFDAVINHVSKSSGYFKGICGGKSALPGIFIEADPEGDYSRVIRPERSLCLQSLRLPWERSIFGPPSVRIRSI